MQLLTSDALKIRADGEPLVGPALGWGFGYGGGRKLVFLDKLHIAVAARLSALAQFGLYPIFFGHLALDGFANHSIKLKQRKSLIYHLFTFLPFYL
jgi:hypothetical protein